MMTRSSFYGLYSGQKRKRNYKFTGTLHIHEFNWELCIDLRFVFHMKRNNNI